jgi:hypothetical protein
MPPAGRSLVEAHTLVRRALGPGAEALRRPAESLSQLYELTGQKAKAEVWRRSATGD